MNVGPVGYLPAQHRPKVGLGQPPIQVEDAGVESLQQLPQSLVSLVHGQELEEGPLGGGPPLETDDPESEEDLQS